MFWHCSVCLLSYVIQINLTTRLHCLLCLFRNMDITSKITVHLLTWCLLSSCLLVYMFCYRVCSSLSFAKDMFQILHCVVINLGNNNSIFLFDPLPTCRGPLVCSPLVCKSVRPSLLILSITLQLSGLFSFTFRYRYLKFDVWIVFIIPVQYITPSDIVWKIQEIPISPCPLSVSGIHNLQNPF